MGPFCSYGHKNIFVVVNYLSKWVKEVALVDNKEKSMVLFLKKTIFSKFGTPRIITNDRGSHFCNNVFWVALDKYYVKQHNVATPYHPKISGQVKVSNRKLRLF